MEINKKVLSAVLGYEVTTVNVTNWENVEINFGQTVIGIYKLAHLCKEWALTKGCQIRSSYMALAFDEPFAEVIVEVGINEEGEKQLLIVTNQGEETEEETIFACCEWILDNQKLLDEIKEKSA